MDVSRAGWGVAWGFEVRDGDLDIDGAHFVGACIVREDGDGIDFVQIVRHLLRVSGLLGLGGRGRHCDGGQPGQRAVADVCGSVCQVPGGAIPNKKL